MFNVGITLPHFILCKDVKNRLFLLMRFVFDRLMESRVGSPECATMLNL